MKPSVIVLTYNSSRFIEQMLNSLKTFAKGCEILVVDNDSKDDSVKIAKQFDFVKVLETGTNLGFAKGLNFGAEKATGDLLLFINPDAVLKSGKMEDLTEVFEKKEDLGVLGGKILDFKGNTENSAGKFFNLWETIAIILGLDNLLGVRFSPNKFESVDFVSGGFMMVRRSVFDKIGGFDEDFFMYVEDMDFCYRMKLAGYKTFFSPDIVIAHAGQGSSSKEFAVINIYKGILNFYKKRKDKLEYSIVRFGLQTKALTVYFLGRITHNSYYIGTYGKALELFR